MQNSEFDYPDKMDAFSINYFKEDIDLIITSSIVKYENLEYKMKNPLLFHDSNNFLTYDIYLLENNNYLWVQNDSSKSPMVAFEISKNFDYWNLIWDITNTNGKYVFESCTRIFPYFALSKNAVIFHGVLMEYKGMGIIVSAPSGTGKTTHARMWRDKKNALIINGDKCLCVKDCGNWIGYGMPWCGTSGEYINRSVSIRAVVILEQSEANSIERLSVLDGFKRGIENVLFPTWESSLNVKAIDLLNDVVSSVPVYNLKCRPDLESVEVLERELNKIV
ncbi:MAG: hypothetical protein ACI4PU_04755 [Intestinibacter sp.]